MGLKRSGIVRCFKDKKIRLLHDDVIAVGDGGIVYRPHTMSKDFTFYSLASFLDTTTTKQTSEHHLYMDIQHHTLIVNKDIESSTLSYRDMMEFLTSLDNNIVSIEEKHVLYIDGTKRSIVSLFYNYYKDNLIIFNPEGKHNKHIVVYFKPDFKEHVLVAAAHKYYSYALISLMYKLRKINGIDI